MNNINNNISASNSECVNSINTDHTFAPQTVTIYSVGLLGGSIGAGLKKSGFDGKIIGLSSDKGLKIARELNLIDESYPYDELSKVITQTDLLILCSPILAIVDTIKKLGDMNLPDGLVITDIGSTKKIIVDAAKKYLPANARFIGGHPMAGSEKNGPSASDPYLFQNAIYALTPAKDDDARIANDLANFLHKYLGCKTIIIDAEKHDKIVAAVSHVPHILASALVLAANEQEKNISGTMSLAAGGFKDMTRIAAAHYDMWHDIFSTNKNAIIPVIDSYINILDDMKQKLSRDELRDDFETGRAIRNSMSFAGKGFAGQLSEILITANDKPGAISSVSTLLANVSINIKDIEVMRVREGEGGTIRLGFESAKTAQRAISILNANGFNARVRS